MIKTTTTQLNPKLLKPSPELMEIQSIMPIASDDKSRLEKDIIKNGVRDAIKVYQNEDGEFLILGGMNRWEIALNCNIEVVPIDIYQGEPDEYRTLVRDDNLNRRHLTTAQKKALIEHELMKSPEKSNRQIAEETKASHVTVAKVRKEKEESGEILPQLETIGKDGKSRTTERDVKPFNPTDEDKKKMDELENKISENNAKKTSVRKSIKCPHCGEEIEI